MTGDELAFAGAAKLAQALRDGEVKSTELTDLFLQRIERINPRLNCFVEVFAEAARADARRAQERLDRGESAPLLGVPVAVKDNFDIAGYVTGHGTSANQTPARADSEVVKRLREAGAVILGKTTLPEFAMWGHFTDSEAQGITRNPWDTSRSSGGSSGGSAAAVAAGLAPIALATDGGGSIRIPSAHCGLFGLKPTRGRASLAPDPEHWSGLSVVGSVARSVADAALFLDVISGPADGDRHVAPPPERPFAESAASEPSSLRIGISHTSPIPAVFVKADRKAALQDAGRLLAELGHVVTEAKVKYPLLLPAFLPRYLRGILHDAEHLGNQERLEKRSRRAVALGRRISDRMLKKSLDVEPKFAAKVAPVFEQFDVLMTPAIAAAPELAGRWRGKGWLRTVYSGSPYIAYTTFWNFTGQPAAVVPIGVDADGLPLSVQLVGRFGDEATLFSLAAQIERARPWADRKPALALLGS
jgi:amidase